ncbi:MAG: inositol monophosphatase family protein, partial [Allosphingosinicella sp.]
MHSATFDRVAELMAEAAETAILPRFRLLAAHEIEEKSPGELVTVADREAEAILTAGLAPLIPGARVLGEEACSADPTLLEGLDEGIVWLVDPLDGTANFAAGEPVFAVMVALLCDGVAHGAWMLNPVSGRLARAELGAGAWFGSERLRAEPLPAGARLRGSLGRFMGPEMLADLSQRIAESGELLPGLRSAGVEYPMIGAAERDFAL